MRRPASPDTDAADRLAALFAEAPARLRPDAEPVEWCPDMQIDHCGDSLHDRLYLAQREHHRAMGVWLAEHHPELPHDERTALLYAGTRYPPGGPWFTRE